jgi:hypothetical protein
VGPSIAASAAAWATAAACVVDWPCSVAIASTTCLGATVNPTRQPVIANAFDTPSMMMVWARTAGLIVAGWKNLPSP